MCGRESITDFGGSNEHKEVLDCSWASGRRSGGRRYAGIGHRVACVALFGQSKSTLAAACVPGKALQFLSYAGQRRGGIKLYRLPRERRSAAPAGANSVSWGYQKLQGVPYRARRTRPAPHRDESRCIVSDRFPTTGGFR